MHQTGILLGLLTLAAVGVSACGFLDPEEYRNDGLCIQSIHSPFVRDFVIYGSSSTIQWTPDGSQVPFDYTEVILDNPERPGVPDIYAVHVGGDPVKKVLDLSSSRQPVHSAWGDTTVFDLSPDGSRIAYTACAVSDDSVQVDDGDKRVYNSEIFVSSFDGSNVERLTNNTHLDTFPAWSPDGESLALISDSERSLDGAGAFRAEDGGYGFGATTRLTVHSMATGQSREIGLPVGHAAAPYRLEWSPNGDRIAFVVLEGEKYPWNLAVYIVGADGTELTRVSDAGSGPTWSPDGEAIALILPEGDEEWVLYIFAADGSNLVKEKFGLDNSKLGGIRGTRLKPGLWMGNLLWSPDGSRILLERFRGADSVVELAIAGIGTGVPRALDARSRAMMTGAGAGSILASPLTTILASYRSRAWSPDGTQIAVRYDSLYSLELYVVDLQGSVTTVVEWERDY